MPLPEISEQQLLFLEEYIKDRNGTRAALAANLSSTYGGAREAARYLLTKPDIKRWVKHLLRESAKRLKFTPGKITRNWMLAATVDPTCIEVGRDGRLTTAPGVPREYLRAVRKWKQTKSVRVVDGGDGLVEDIKTEIELRDPFGPECKLMEHFGEAAGDGAGGVKEVHIPPKEPPPDD